MDSKNNLTENPFTFIILHYLPQVEIPTILVVHT